MLKQAINNRGAGIVELAVLIPFLVFVAFAGFDLARALSVNEKLSMLSRELANESFRLCSHISSDTPDAETTVCLQNAVDTVANAANAALSGAEFVVSVYRWDEDTNSVIIHATDIVPPSGVTAGGRGTKFDTTRVAADLQSLSDLNPTIVISEAFYSHVPITAYAFTTGNFYEVAVY